MRLKSEETMVLVIDIQERLLPVIHEGEAMAKRTSTFLQGTKLLGLPTVVLRQYPKGLGDTVPEIKQALEGIEPVDKRCFSACGEPEAVEAIRAAGRKNVLIVGIEAHICVLQSVIDLAAMGLQPVLVCDCVSSRRAYDTEIALRRAQQEGATLATGEMLLFELLGRAEGDTFKGISALVK